jgi:hypothetical protein
LTVLSIRSYDQPNDGESRNWRPGFYSNSSSFDARTRSGTGSPRSCVWEDRRLDALPERWRSSRCCHHRRCEPAGRDETREERGARGTGVSATNDRRIPGRSRWNAGRNLVAPPTLPSNGRVPCDVYVSERPTWLVVILASSHPARLHSRRNLSVRITRFLWMTANLRFAIWRFNLHQQSYE